MASEACAAINTSWPDLVSGCAAYDKRTLEALVSAWSSRADKLPPSILAAIFDDLLADAGPIEECIELHPSEVFIDVRGIAKIDSPRVERADVRAVTALLDRVSGLEAPSAIDSERARAWLAAEVAVPAPRDEVRAYIDAVRVADSEGVEREWTTGDIVFPAPPPPAEPAEVESVRMPDASLEIGDRRSEIQNPKSETGTLEADLEEAGDPSEDEGPEEPAVPRRVVRHTLPRTLSPVRVEMAPAARRSARPRGNSRLLLPTERAHSRAWAVAFLLLGIAALLSIFGLRGLPGLPG